MGGLPARFWEILGRGSQEEAVGGWVLGEALGGKTDLFHCNRSVLGLLALITIYHSSFIPYYGSAQLGEGGRKAVGGFGKGITRRGWVLGEALGGKTDLFN